MKWIKAKNGSEWLSPKSYLDKIGIVALIDTDNILWQARNGKSWSSEKLEKDIEFWLDNGFEYCTEQEAKDLLNNK
jgi:hypothetical protein